MIYDTLEEAINAQKLHYDSVKSSCYLNSSDSEKSYLDSYYKITTSIYDIRKTDNGKFEYPHDGIYLTEIKDIE